MCRWIAMRSERFRQTLRRWRDADGSLLAAAMAYYAVLAFFPLLLVLISLLGLALRFGGPVQDAQTALLDMVAAGTSPALAGHVRDALAAVQSGASLGGPLGLVVLLATGVSMFAQVDKIMDRIWGRATPRAEGVVAAIRTVLLYRLRAFLMLLGLGGLVLAAFAANLVASALKPWAVEWFDGRSWSLLQSGASLLVNGVLLTAIYVVLPKARVMWKHALRGGVLATVLWELTRQVLSLAVFGHRYSTYGLVGSVLLLMVWAYVASAVFVFSAGYVRILCDNPAKTSPGEAEAP